MLRIKFWVIIDWLSKRNLRHKSWLHVNFYFIGLMLSSFSFNMVNVSHSVTHCKIRLCKRHSTLLSNLQWMFPLMIMEHIILKTQFGLMKMVVEQDHGFIKAVLSSVTSRLSQTNMQWDLKCWQLTFIVLGVKIFLGMALGHISAELILNLVVWILLLII